MGGNMILYTERLQIHIASREEMESFIGTQTDPELLKAYREMLQGAIEHPKEWAWYAIWMIERKDGTPVGDLSFKGLLPSGISIYYLLHVMQHVNTIRPTFDTAVTE